MHQEFLLWLHEWVNKLPSKVFEDFDNPERIAIISVDMVNGFCHKGSLASTEVKSIIPNVVHVFKKAKNYGVENFVLLQDAHHHEATEFEAYPPHCVKGTDEADAIPELKELSFANQFVTIEKNALSPAYETYFDEWLLKHPKVDTFIIVGDCTDLCVYSVAMHLRLYANAKNLNRRIIVPSNAVATYDMPVKKAQKIGALPHDEKLLHPLFLYHMALNAIEVIKEIK